MNQLDTLYRAFVDYKKQTEENRECGFERRAIVSSNPEKGSIEMVRTICTIKEDWINAIKKGLIHVEKAINEGRQFIRSRGEVVPIEKVKRVSKNSIEHLAKHSDLITKEHGGDDLIPDKLYVVERLSDFAVYENRFLYMLLCYLRSFISLRYNKILELTNTYHGDVLINKVVTMNKHKLVFELKLTDIKQDDQYLKEHNQLHLVIDRIALLLKEVMHLLDTPLMQEVSKVPILKPPITKTNVLKMNRNFKGAVALYDFVTAYNNTGYSVEKSQERINPFPDDTAEEFAEVVMLTSFLAYKYGLGLKKFLKKSYEEEEERRKAAEIQKQKEQLIQLKRRIAESGCDSMEYILLLERRNKMLEIDSAQLIASKTTIKNLHKEADVLNEKIQSLNAIVKENVAEIASLNQKHFDEMSNLKSAHEQENRALHERYKSETDEIKQQYKIEIDSLNLEYKNAIITLNEVHKAKIDIKESKISELEGRLSEEQTQFRQQLKKSETEYFNKINELQVQHQTEAERLEVLNNKKNIEYENLLCEKALSDSRLNALRKEYNLIDEDEDFTAKVSFDELEHQFKVFKAFFKDEWNKTKKKIRKEILKSEHKEKDKANEVVVE